MDLNSVNIFVLVVRAGSFSAAGKKSGIPVATVSRRVSELEQALQVRLLERSTRHLRLTDAGSEFYEAVLRGIDTLEDARLSLLNREKSLSGTLRLSIPPNFEPMWQITQSFQAEHSKVNIEIFVTERKVDMIEDGIDVVLRVGEPLHQSMISRQLTTCRHFLVASPDFIERHGYPANPQELINFRCAGWNSRYGKVQWKLGGKDWDINPFCLVNDFAQLKCLALSGGAIVELPDFLAINEIKQGKLVRVLENDPFPVHQLTLLYPSRQQLSRIIRSFIDYCIDHVDEFRLGCEATMQSAGSHVASVTGTAEYRR